MSVELPFAPVDAIIRRNAEDLRVSAAAAEELAQQIQRRGATLAVEAAHRAEAAGRTTLLADDFDVNDLPDRENLTLPIAPIDRIARLRIDDEFRVGMDTRIALAARLEAFADDVAEGAALLASHADRKTVKAEDIRTYLHLRE